MDNHVKWSRRKFTKAVIYAHLLLASGSLGFLASCTEESDPNTMQPLSAKSRELLSLAMAEIIPASEKMPSAADAGGVQYLVGILEEYPELIPLFAELSDQLLKDDFAGLEPAQRIEVLKELEKTQPELFGVLKEFTYEAYYTNAEVWKLIGYEPFPTNAMGPVMDPFDESLLDRVKALPPQYTKI